MAGEWFRMVMRWALDFALPPRCAGCGTIIGEVHSFCHDCWRQVEFLGDSGCSTCGLPLQATEQRTCGACLAKPPRIARTRAAVAYGDVARSLAIRLKYGRKVAIARTMARYMAPLVGQGSDRLLVPVPLHRTRLWSRGFNQSALVARELSPAPDCGRSACAEEDSADTATQGNESAPAPQGRRWSVQGR